MSGDRSLRVLLLSPYLQPGLDLAINAAGDRVVQLAGSLTGSLAGSRVDPADFDWTLCYGHREILEPDVVARARGRIVNLHVAFLPWNRGAHPNLWSIVEGTPSGVSLHFLDAGIDTGDLIAQTRVTIGDEETLESSYARLRAAGERLFAETWPALRSGRAPRWPQPEGGSSHRVRDLEQLVGFMPQGWQTPVGDVRRLAATRRAAAS